MIFEKDGNIIKFRLVGLGEVEQAEISGLIIQNGGQLCDEPTTIGFTDEHGYNNQDPIFHTNYIRECIKQKQLLDLINFKFGDAGLHGCLMSILIYGKNTCPFINGLAPCCSCTRVKSDPESSQLTSTEHDCKHVDAAVVAEESACSHTTAANTGLKQEDFVPDKSPFPMERDISPNKSSLPKETEQIPHKIEECQVNSSDRDDMIDEPTTATNHYKCRMDAKSSSPPKSQEISVEIKISTQGDQIPGPSRAHDTLKDNMKTEVPNTNERFKSSPRAIQIRDSDSDSASADEACSSVGKIALARNFLPWEQRQMVWYLTDRKRTAEAKGNTVWKQMIRDGFLKHRTYQSLNNHFRKSILPNIEQFVKKGEDLKRFKKLKLQSH